MTHDYNVQLARTKNSNFDTAVLLTALPRLIVANGFVLAETDDGNTEQGNILRDEIALDCLGPTFTQVDVVGFVTFGGSEPLDLNDEARCKAAHLTRDAIQRRLGSI